jgi:hypothetical protein
MTEKNLFTTGNIRKFFHTETTGLPGNVSALVKSLGDNYGASAFAIVESGASQPALIEPVINNMISSYCYSVGLLSKGWGVGGTA